jgi:hypothetical protein
MGSERDTTAKKRHHSVTDLTQSQAQLLLDRRHVLKPGTGLAMMTELDAIMGSDLVTMVFLYGSAALLIASMIVVTWLCEPKRSRASKRVGQSEAALLKVVPHR